MLDTAIKNKEYDKVYEHILFTKGYSQETKMRTDSVYIIRFTFSQGTLQKIRKHNILWVEDEIEKFIELVHNRFRNETKEAIFSYRMRLAKKQ